MAQYNSPGTYTEVFTSPVSGRPHTHQFEDHQLVHCDREQFEYQGFCKWVNPQQASTQRDTQEAGYDIARAARQAERHQVYQQYQQQRPRPDLFAPTFLGDELKASSSLYLQGLGVAVDGAAVVGRLLAEVGRELREAYFAKSAEKAAEWRDAPTGAIKHLPPGGSAE